MAGSMAMLPCNAVIGSAALARPTPTRTCVLCAQHSRPSLRPNRYCSPRFVSRATAEAVSKGDTNLEEGQGKDDDFDDSNAPDDAHALTTQQVQSLLNVVCGETEVAEVELKVGGFSLKVRRKLTGFPQSAETGVSLNGAAVQPTSASELPFQSTASMDESQILPQQSSDGSVSSVDEDDWKEENLLYLGAPKVGILRRGRYLKGKKVGKGPVADVGTKVKKGQPLAYIEQLGTFVPVLAPQAGEIVNFTVEEGKAVEYKEVLVEIAPFFGGHIIGDKKYA